MALPPIDTIRHLLERLRANDVTWFREKYKSGDLNWLKDHLPGDGFSKLGGQLEAGNLDGLRNALPEVPGLTELPGVGALLGGLGGVGAAGAAAASKLGGAVTGGASKATGAAADAARRTTTATTTMVSGDGNRKKGLAWLIPVVLIVAALAALGLTKCKNDDDE